MATGVELESMRVPRRPIRPRDRGHPPRVDSPILLTLLDELQEAQDDARRLLGERSAGVGSSLDLEQRAVLDRLSVIRANLEALRRL